MEQSFYRKEYKKCLEKYRIMPCNRDVYPHTRFHVNLLNGYENWLENGKEDLSAEQLDELFNVERNKENTTLEDTSLESPTGFYQGEKGTFVTYFIPDGDPSYKCEFSQQ